MSSSRRSAKIALASLLATLALLFGVAIHVQAASETAPAATASLGSVATSSGLADLASVHAAGTPNPACQLSNPIMSALCGFGQLILNALSQVGTTAVNTVVAPIANDIGNTLANLGVDFSVWVLSGVQTAIVHISDPNQFKQPWFMSNFTTMRTIGLMMMLPVLLAAYMHGIFKRDPGHLLRVTFINVPAAILLTASAVTLTGDAMTITDELSNGFTQFVNFNQQVPAGTTATTAITTQTGPGQGLTTEPARLTAAQTPPTNNPNLATCTARLNDPGIQVGFAGLITNALCDPKMPSLAVFIGGILGGFGGLLVLGIFFLHDIVIYVVLLLLPLALSASVWPSRAVWAKRLGQLMMSTIIAKLLIFAILAMGLLFWVNAAPSMHIPAGSQPTIIFWLVVLFLLGFGPIKLMKMAFAVVGGTLREVSNVAQGKSDPTSGSGTYGDSVRQLQADRAASKVEHGDHPHATPHGRHKQQRNQMREEQLDGELPPGEQPKEGKRHQAGVETSSPGGAGGGGKGGHHEKHALENQAKMQNRHRGGDEFAHAADELDHTTSGAEQSAAKVGSTSTTTGGGSGLGGDLAGTGFGAVGGANTITGADTIIEPGQIFDNSAGGVSPTSGASSGGFSGGLTPSMEPQTFTTQAVGDTGSAVAQTAVRAGGSAAGTTAVETGAEVGAAVGVDLVPGVGEVAMGMEAADLLYKGAKKATGTGKNKR